MLVPGKLGEGMVQVRLVMLIAMMVAMVMVI